MKGFYRLLVDYEISILDENGSMTENYRTHKKGEVFHLEDENEQTLCGADCRLWATKKTNKKYYRWIEIPKDDLENHFEKVEEEVVFQFDNFQEWVEKASSYYSCVDKRKVKAVDTDGNVCKKGIDFMNARDKKLFPVKVVYKVARWKKVGE